MAYQPKKQVKSPFGVKPDTIKTQTSSSNNSLHSNSGKSPRWKKSGDQTPSDWVTVKSSSYGQDTPVTFSYTVDKAPKKFNIKPKNKALPDNPDEPNALWHAQPKQDPSATVCAICMNKFQNSSIMVDGTKIHRGCFKCGKCGKTMNHEQPSSYTRLNDITLHFREKYICSNCKVQSKYGAYGKCTACNKDLPPVYFEDSDGHKFHNACFNCMDCGKSLANFTERFFSTDGGDRYCKKCSQKRAWPDKK